MNEEQARIAYAVLLERQAIIKVIAECDWTGGGTTDDWMNLIAEITERPVLVPPCPKEGP